MRDLIFRMAGVLAAATLLVANGGALAATLVLNDGTVIQGEIQSLQNDVYAVKTDSLGTLRVRKQDIRTIDHSVGNTQASSLGLTTTGSTTSSSRNSDR